MTTLTSISPPHSFEKKRNLSNLSARVINRLVIAFCVFSALLTISALFLIFGYVLYRGFSALVTIHPFHFDWAFFTALPGSAETGASLSTTGMRNCIAGSLVLIAMSSCLGVPLGMLCGIYLAEYARDNWFSHAIRLVVDVLAGVPSIIVGVLAYELLVVPMKTNSAWAGAVALGFMMCPIIARTTEEMLRLVPCALREASIGVGASKFQTLVRVVIPSASAGIITGIMLAVARVAGETAPLLFTVLGSDLPVFSANSTFPYFHADLNHAFPSLTVQIFKYAQSAESDWNRQAWAGMLLLIVIVLVLNICVRLASNRTKRLRKA